MTQPPMNCLRAVLFDLDGTLVDSLPTIAEAMSRAFALHGHALDPDEVVPRIGPPMNVVALETPGVTPDQAERINEAYLRLYHDEFIRLTPPHAGAGELIAALRAAGLWLAVVTNKTEYGARMMVEVQGWDPHFEVIVGRDTAIAPKPSAEAARFALDRMGVPPAAAAIVGDTEFDMQCGRDASLACVIGVLGARNEEHLRAYGATHVVRSLAEVAPILLGDGAGR